MKKAQLSLIAELDLGDTEDFTEQLACKFTGTDNPRHLRVIHSLMIRPRRREEIDRIAGASNGPDLMLDLRRIGISQKARMVRGIDRDGYPVKFGIYEFNDDDRRAVNAWLRKRDAKANP